MGHLDRAVADADQAILASVASTWATSSVPSRSRSAGGPGGAPAASPSPSPTRRSMIARTSASARRGRAHTCPRRVEPPRRERRRTRGMKRASACCPDASARARAARWTAAAARPARPPRRRPARRRARPPRGGPLRGGQLDDTPQLRGVHRPDQHLALPQQLGKGRISREPPVEVRSQRDDHDRAAFRIGGRAGKSRGESGPLGRRPAGGEELLQLIDGEEKPSARRQRVERLGQRFLAPETSTRRSASIGCSPAGATRDATARSPEDSRRAPVGGRRA